VLVALAVAVLAVTVLELLLVGSGRLPSPGARSSSVARCAAVLLAGLRALHVTELDPPLARLRRRRLRGPRVWMGRGAAGTTVACWVVQWEAECWRASLESR
jgi:hypothetical protein